MKCFPLLQAATLLILSASSLAAQTWSPGSIEFSRLAGFSQSIVIDGDHIIATRTGESVMFPSPASQKGGVFIFQRDGNGWSQIQDLVPDDAEIGDRFGHAMVLGGDLLFVSAPGAHRGCGAIFVFGRSDQGWGRHSRIDNEGCEMDERLGWSLAYDSGTLYVGAPGDDELPGALHIYLEHNGGWQKDKVLEGASNGDGFGESVAASADGFIVSSPNAGGGEVHVRMGDHEEQVLSPSDESVKLFGLEMALEGHRVLIAAPGIRGREIGFGVTMPAKGRVFVYEADKNGMWNEEGVLELALDGEQSPQMAFGYGTSLALTRNEAWVGVPFGGSGAGAVYVYKHGAGNGWDNTQVLSTRPLAVGAGFGTQVAVSGDLGVIGAIRADFGEGKGVVYTKSSNTWQEEVSINDSGRGLVALTGDERRCIDGAVDLFGCEDVNLLSFLPVGDVGGGRGVIVNDVWGWTDPQTKREYAVIGRSNGTSFVDVTDPTYPVFVGDLPATEGSSPNAWRDVKVYRDYAFVVADNVGKHGMQIFDMKNLRGLEGRPATLEATTIYDEIYSAHNVVINEESGFAYIVAASGGGETCGGGYHMVDVRNPEEPRFAGCFSDPSSGAGGNHIHDAQCVNYDGPDEDYRGKEICFGANASVFSIADVTDKDNPQTLSALDYPNVAYVHQGWLTEDKKYFYINDEGDEVGGLTERTRTLIWDVEDLDDPVFVKAHLGTTAASDHNFYIRDNLMYQSNYVSGLQILDISDPLNPREVGHFDTVPWGENAPGFAGSWSNYPYFESGTIVVSSITEGIFLVRKQPEEMP